MCRGFDEDDEAEEDERRGEHGDGLKDAFPERHPGELSEQQGDDDRAEQQYPENRTHLRKPSLCGGSAADIGRPHRRATRHKVGPKPRFGNM